TRAPEKIEMDDATMTAASACASEHARGPSPPYIRAVFEQPWLSEWDYLSRVNRVVLVLQIVVVAPALLTLGVVMTVVRHTWFGLVMGSCSVCWLGCRGCTIRRSVQSRRGGGWPPPANVRGRYSSLRFGCWVDDFAAGCSTSGQVARPRVRGRYESARWSMVTI